MKTTRQDYPVPRQGRLRVPLAMACLLGCAASAVAQFGGVGARGPLQTVGVDPFARPAKAAVAASGTISNATLWRVEFLQPARLALEPGGTASFEGEPVPRDRVFRVEAPVRNGDAWTICVEEAGWPRVRVSWDEAPDKTTEREIRLPEEVIRAGGGNADEWLQAELAQACGVSPDAWEGWTATWNAPLRTDLAAFNSVTVTWHPKPPAKARVVNGGNVPLRWGTNEIPAGKAVDVSWEEAVKLRETNAVTAAPTNGMPADAFWVNFTDWPEESTVSPGTTNHVVVKAEQKPGPAVMIYNDGPAEIRGRNNGGPKDSDWPIIAAKWPWCYVPEPPPRRGTQFNWTFLVCPTEEQRGQWDWPETVKVSFSMPAWGETNECRVAFEPVEKAPVTLVVTNPGPLEVVVGVENVTLAPGESKHQTIPWTAAWNHPFAMSWTFVDGGKGQQEVVFGAPGETQTVACVPSSKPAAAAPEPAPASAAEPLPEPSGDTPAAPAPAPASPEPATVTLSNTGRVPLRVSFAGRKELSIDSGGELVLTGIPPPADGASRTVSFAADSASDVWSGGEVQWKGEARLELRAVIDGETVIRAVTNVAAAAKALGSQPNRFMWDKTAYTDNGLKRLRGCGLTEADLPSGAGELPDWGEFRDGVWEKVGENSEEWDLVEPFASWDEFMSREGEP